MELLLVDDHESITLLEKMLLAFGARVYFRDLHEEAFDIGPFHIETMRLSHPDNCLG